MTEYNWTANVLNWRVEDFTRFLVIAGVLATLMVYGTIVARKISSLNRRRGRRSRRRW